MYITLRNFVVAIMELLYKFAPWVELWPDMQHVIKFKLYKFILLIVCMSTLASNMNEKRWRKFSIWTAIEGINEVYIQLNDSKLKMLGYLEMLWIARATLFLFILSGWSRSTEENFYFQTKFQQLFCQSHWTRSDLTNT